MRIPEVIVKACENKDQIDWVEEHDLLKMTSDRPYDEQNQLDWWRKNVEIRTAFHTIEKEIKGLLKKGQKVTKRIVTWTRVAKLSNCDRNTLRHPKRGEWTKERFDFLIELVNNEIDKQEQVNVVDVTESRILELETNIIKARNETAKWMDKYLLLEKEHKTIQRVVKMKENEIFVRDRKIRELLEKIDDT